jgi:DNA-binding winged helix-turn-helix (wHTH) protein
MEGKLFVTPADREICFGPYRLDRTSGRLLRGSTSLPLRLKAFAVLEYLATHPGRLVPKDELLDAVWPATHVTPSVLTGCIRELRRALGDDARAARFVETVHRRGYRFVAAQARSAEGPETGDANAGPLPSRARDAELATLARQFALAVNRVVQLGRRGRTPSFWSGRRTVCGRCRAQAKRGTKRAHGKLR